MTRRNAVDPDRFTFFDSGHQLLTLSPSQVAPIQAAFLQLGHQHIATHPYREDILRARIAVLLYELQAVSEARQPSTSSLENRGRHLTNEFKQLVRTHFAIQRSVAFYARALSITPRHLSATVRAHTGKTATQWIQETVALEARLLLQDASLTVAQIADHLHFPDQSTFGKYFRHVAGVSPLAYRKELPANPTF